MEHRPDREQLGVCNRRAGVYCSQLQDTANDVWSEQVPEVVQLPPDWKRSEEPSASNRTARIPLEEINGAQRCVPDRALAVA